MNGKWVTIRECHQPPPLFSSCSKEVLLQSAYLMLSFCFQGGEFWVWTQVLIVRSWVCDLGGMTAKLVGGQCRIRLLEAPRHIFSKAPIFSIKSNVAWCPHNTRVHYAKEHTLTHQMKRVDSICNVKTKTFVLSQTQNYETVRRFAYHVRHSEYNSTWRALLQANLCISLSKFCFRNSWLSILINDEWFKRCCDVDDLNSFFIRFNFENDISPLQFEHIKQRCIRRIIAKFGKSDIRILSWIRRLINVSCDSSREPWKIV